jgi:hypothetical protein
MMVQDPNKHGKKDNAARVEALFEKARASGATMAESSAPTAPAARPRAFQGRANTLAGSGSGSGSDAVSCAPPSPLSPCSVSMYVSLAKSFVAARSWLASTRHKNPIVGRAFSLVPTSLNLPSGKCPGSWRSPRHCGPIPLPCGAHLEAWTTSCALLDSSERGLIVF